MRDRSREFSSPVNSSGCHGLQWLSWTGWASWGGVGQVKTRQWHVPGLIRVYGRDPSFRGVSREFRSLKRFPCPLRTEHPSLSQSTDDELLWSSFVPSQPIKQDICIYIYISQGLLFFNIIRKPKTDLSICMILNMYYTFLCPSIQNWNVISSKTPTLTHLIIHPLNLNDTLHNSCSVPSGPLKSDLSIPLTPFGKAPLIRRSAREYADALVSLAFE